MKRIAFIVPFFGKLPDKGFDLWLYSCGFNDTIDWILYTDDRTKYHYPKNVIVNYCTLEDIKKRAQKCFDFNISLERPRKLCDFRPAYGEIFADELKNYDFWGYCDIDLVWGDIRHFINDNILDKYDRIGYQGHCQLYRNSPEINRRYRTIIEGINNYRMVLSDPGEYIFDENGMDGIYNALKIPYYRETIFAHLNKYDYGFFLAYFPEKDDYKNKHQVFILDNGKLLRKYEAENTIHTEEFMYLHFFCRPIKFRFDNINNGDRFLIYADSVKKLKSEVTVKLIHKHSNNSAFHYYTTSIWYNRRKLTLTRISANIKRMILKKKGRRNL